MKKKWKIYIKKIGELPIHQFSHQLSLNELLWDFDAVRLYPSAMIDDKIVYPRIESGYPFIPVMNDDLVEIFNIETFTRGSAILKTK